MMHLNADLDYVKVFIDDTAVISRNSLFKKYLKELDEILTYMEDAGLQLNISKTKQAVSEAKYLGFIVSKIGYKLDKKKIEALLNAKLPKNKKQVKQFLGSMNFYHKIWDK